MKPTAQSLVLQILSVADGQTMPVRALVEAAGMFGITDNNLRVTLARLLARGLIARDERGRYRLAADGLAVQAHVAEWVHLDDRMVPWTGGWIGVHTAALPRGNRTRQRQRQRQRALDFLGFRELTSALWIRPDNLTGGTADVQRRLRELGLEPEAIVFAMAELDDATDRRARGLWDMDARLAEYREVTRAIEDGIVRIDTLPLDEGMVEAFLLGGRALRLLAFDPLLPDEICPGEARRGLVEAMLRYDALGRGVWSRFMRERNAPKFDTLLQHGSFDDAAVRAAGV